MLVATPLRTKPHVTLVAWQGRTKQHIEEATRTRVVIADHRVHVLGSIDGIQQARLQHPNASIAAHSGGWGRERGEGNGAKDHVPCLMGGESGDGTADALGGVYPGRAMKTPFASLARTHTCAAIGANRYSRVLELSSPPFCYRRSIATGAPRNRPHIDTITCQQQARYFDWLRALRAGWQRGVARPGNVTTNGSRQARNVISDLVMGRPTAKANKKLSAISARFNRDF